MGHLLSVALLALAALAFLVSLVIRPPRGVRAAARRLALGLAVIFTVGPNDRFGYFVYPLGIFGWLVLTSDKSAVTARTARFLARLASGRGHWALPGRRAHAGMTWRRDAPAAAQAGQRALTSRPPTRRTA